jgi:hypothetical protein
VTLVEDAGWALVPCRRCGSPVKIAYGQRRHGFLWLRKRIEPIRRRCVDCNHCEYRGKSTRPRPLVALVGGGS